MSAKIYLIRADDTLQPLEEQPYPNEDLLQTLLEKYPELLAGEEINQSNPRRWLLISREVSIPDEEQGGKNMYLDHLFLDQEGIPTLVEVKRSSDTRIRREVIGQMLDYAANAVVYWPIEEIRTRFELACEKRQEDVTAVITAFIQTDLDDDTAVESFWAQVKTNLQAGKIRMVFVADAIQPQLRRIIEFLNEQMDPAEVLGVELRQFIGSGIRTIVPRVIGQTVEAQQKKSGARRETYQWDEATFFAELQVQVEDTAVTTVRRIFNWAKEHVDYISWGKGKVTGSFVPILKRGGTNYQLFAIWTRENAFQLRLIYKRPFDSPVKQQELITRLNEIEGMNLPANAVNFQPTTPLAFLADEDHLTQLLSVYEWAIAEINKAN